MYAHKKRPVDVDVDVLSVVVDVEVVGVVEVVLVVSVVVDVLVDGVVVDVDVVSENKHIDFESANFSSEKCLQNAEKYRMIGLIIPTPRVSNAQTSEN